MTQLIKHRRRGESLYLFFSVNSFWVGRSPHGAIVYFSPHEPRVASLHPSPTSKLTRDATRKKAYDSPLTSKLGRATPYHAVKACADEGEECVIESAMFSIEGDNLFVSNVGAASATSPDIRPAAGAASASASAAAAAAAAAAGGRGAASSVHAPRAKTTSGLICCCCCLIAHHHHCLT